MAVAKAIDAQRDFSAGEIDLAAKRADQASDVGAILKSGLRQATNVRILNSKAVQNRCGRSAVMTEQGRVEEVLMAPGSKFFLVFGNGYLRVYAEDGFKAFDQSGMPWLTTSVNQVVWDVSGLSIYIAFVTGAPQVLTWDGVSTWSLANFSELVNVGQKRTPFYRISPPNITLTPSATTGSVTLTASAAVFKAGMVGARLRWVARQLLITAFTNSATVTATVEEVLNSTLEFQCALDPRSQFSVGDVVVGQTSGASGIVTSMGVAGGNFFVHTVMLSGIQWFAPANNGEAVVGPAGKVVTIALSVTTVSPEGVSDWDEEVMNAYRGWPASVFVDQGRLGFCNFPAVPSGIAWSAIGTPTDLYVGANPSDAIFEIAPGKSQVQFVVPGAESNEFVFADNAVYYIPITVANPLKPGSVAFNLLSRDGCAANVQPRQVQEIVLFLNSGRSSIMTILTTGAYQRPHEVKNLSELHGHLIRTPIAIAVPQSTVQFEERYAYVLNSDGTVAVGKYAVQGGQIVGSVGWVPWSGAGSFVNWIAALGGDVVCTTSYPGLPAGIEIVELVDNSQYLDAQITVNAPPAALAKLGFGPLWMWAGSTVSLIDQGWRMMGTYQVDATGHIVPQSNAGEDLSSSTLVAGQPWIMVVEPFAPAATPGPDGGQRLYKRRMARLQIYVESSSGFLVETLATQSGAQLPAPGTPWRSRRVTAWNMDDDPTLPPPLRERAYAFKPTGRAHDPRVAIVKDTPGPLVVVEIALRVTV